MINNVKIKKIKLCVLSSGTKLFTQHGHGIAVAMEGQQKSPLYPVGHLESLFNLFSRLMQPPSMYNRFSSEQEDEQCNLVITYQLLAAEDVPQLVPSFERTRIRAFISAAA